LGELAASKLRLFASTTQEPSQITGRVTDWISDGRLFDQMGVPTWNAAEDRVMICGSLPMCKDVAALAEGAGLKEGANSEPGDFVIERAFVG